MTDVDPVRRLSAREALDRLSTIVHSMAPQDLLIEPKLRQLPEPKWIQIEDLPSN